MKLIGTVLVFDIGGHASRADWQTVHAACEEAITQMVHPPGSEATDDKAVPYLKTEKQGRSEEGAANPSSSAVEFFRGYLRGVAREVSVGEGVRRGWGV